MTEADRKRINNEYAKQLKLWRQRKRMVRSGSRSHRPSGCQKLGRGFPNRPLVRCLHR
jgi:hypothetical protein